ncbi:DsbA family protein [Jonesia quinghaiensis]|uniref:DsbA family protein n=1 Tax=Jonesia quinghaiensis TaxID=262806 RepID=UPI0003F61A07|nr:thioredoxin domain-containing protein [Jonesia quinghaiensis]
MSSPNPPAKSTDRREEARQRAMKIQQEQEARERRSRLIVLISVILGVGLVVGIGYWILSQQQSDVANVTEFPDDVAVPSVASPEDGAITVFNGELTSETPAGVPVVDVYLDFMCTHCADFEMTNGEWMKEAANSGEFAMRLHPIAILGSQYSETIGSAFFYIAENSPEHALDFAYQAFANYSQTGQSDDQLRAHAETVGVPQEHIDKMLDGDYVRFIKAASSITLSDESLRNADGGFGTPAVFINDEYSTVNWTDPNLLREAISSAEPVGGAAE